MINCNIDSNLSICSLSPAQRVIAEFNHYTPIGIKVWVLILIGVILIIGWGLFLNWLGIFRDKEEGERK